MDSIHSITSSFTDPNWESKVGLHPVSLTSSLILSHLSIVVKLSSNVIDPHPFTVGFAP